MLRSSLSTADFSCYRVSPYPLRPWSRMKSQALLPLSDTAITCVFSNQGKERSTHIAQMRPHLPTVPRTRERHSPKAPHLRQGHRIALVVQIVRPTGMDGTQMETCAVRVRFKATRRGTRRRQRLALVASRQRPQELIVFSRSLPSPAS